MDANPHPPNAVGLASFVRTSLGLIGAGRMATALAKGCVAARLVEPSDILASDPEATSRQSFTAAIPGAVVVVDNAAVVSRAQIVVLAVKPQKMAEALASLREAVHAGHLVVSIAAGVTLERLGRELPAGTRIVRVMPNTPCLIGRGASAYCRGALATEADANQVKRLLESMGRAYEVEESQMDAVTGLSGSGPAFAYTVVEALAAGGVEAGLPAALALELAIQTVGGAAAMCETTRLSPSELRDQVTSPGGTTLAGLAALAERGGAAALQQAVVAAARRSRELGAA